MLGVGETLLLHRAFEQSRKVSRYRLVMPSVQGSRVNLRQWMMRMKVASVIDEVLTVSGIRSK